MFIWDFFGFGQYSSFPGPTVQNSETGAASFCSEPEDIDDGLLEGASGLQRHLADAKWAAFWGWDCCGPQGLLERLYQALDIPERSWSGLKRMPGVAGLDMASREDYMAMVDSYMAVLDSTVKVRRTFKGTRRKSRLSDVPSSPFQGSVGHTGYLPSVDRLLGLQEAEPSQLDSWQQAEIQVLEGLARKKDPQTAPAAISFPTASFPAVSSASAGTPALAAACGGCGVSDPAEAEAWARGVEADPRLNAADSDSDLEDDLERVHLEDLVSHRRSMTGGAEPAPERAGPREFPKLGPEFPCRATGAEIDFQLDWERAPGGSGQTEERTEGGNGAAADGVAAGGDVADGTAADAATGGPATGLVPVRAERQRVKLRDTPLGPAPGDDDDGFWLGCTGADASPAAGARPSVPHLLDSFDDLADFPASPPAAAGRQGYPGDERDNPQDNPAALNPDLMMSFIHAPPAPPVALAPVATTRRQPAWARDPPPITDRPSGGSTVESNAAGPPTSLEVRPEASPKAVGALWELLEACIAAQQVAPAAATDRQFVGGREPSVRWYDARARSALRRLAVWMNVPWRKVATFEHLLAYQLRAAAIERRNSSMWEQAGKAAKIGATVLGAGALFALTGQQIPSSIFTSQALFPSLAHCPLNFSSCSLGNH